MKRFLVNFGLVGISLSIGLLMVEFALRLPAINQLVDHSPDRRLYRLNPETGWSLNPNVQIVWNTDNFGDDDIKVEVQINSLGLRDIERSYQKPAGTFRVLLLGDSFTEGLQVPLEQTFPARLQVCLNERLSTPIEVINGGVSAYSLGEEYLFYTSEGVKYDPDLVLIAFYAGNDLADLDRNDNKGMIRDFGGYKFTLEKGQLNKTWLDWAEPYQEKISGVERLLRRTSMLYRVLRHPNYKFYWEYQQWLASLQKQLGLEPDPDQSPLPDWDVYVFTQDFTNRPDTPLPLKDMWLLFQAIFEEMRQATATNGDQLAVMIIPEKRQVHYSLLKKQVEIMSHEFSEYWSIPWDLEEPDRSLVNYLDRVKVPVLDLLPYFRAHEALNGYLLYLENDIHFNADGHRLTADTLCDWLIKNEAISLPRPQTQH